MKKGGKKEKNTYNADISVEFLAEKIIENAFNLHATDVHIEPRENLTLVRFRIHGVLRNFQELPKSIYQNIVEHFKKLGGLNISEKTFAQNSTIQHGKARIRISIVPTFLGEKITLRMIRSRQKVRKLTEIGLQGENLRLVQQAVRQPKGVIITLGNGSNTTNFAILNELISNEKSIITVEKRIEKVIPEISQTEVNPRIGLDYFRATKAALSQNPDVILIDNLRDKQTAEQIFESASRGKLFIVSLPIQRLSEVIPYLEHLGVPNFLISTNILAIISQTLVRTISANALKWKKINKIESQVLLKEFGINISKLHEIEKSAKKHLANQKLRTSSSDILEVPILNEEIGDMGYIGSTGIFEVASLLNGKFGSKFKNLISTSPNSAEIEDFLDDEKFTTLKIDGIAKSLSGETSLKEILRKTGY